MTRAEARPGGSRPGPRALSALLLLTLGLAGCSWVDADQARICRSALPALEQTGSRIEVLRIAAGRDARSVRIDYLTTLGPRSRTRFALCRFAADGLQAGKAELVDVVTPEGPLGGARTYLLRRYYLETAEGLAGDPAAGERASPLPELPASLAYGLQQALAGLPLTAIYALLAAAYALVFGLAGRINLAFGEIAAVGAAAAGLGVAAAGIGGMSAALPGLALGVLLAVFAGAVHSATTGTLTFGWIPRRNAQATLIATVGLSLALMEYLRLAAGTMPVWIPPVGGAPLALARSGSFVVTVTPVAIATALIGFLAAIGLVIGLRRSAYGRGWRAVSQDGLAAALFGIDEGRLLRATLAIAGGLAGLAGALVALQFGALGFAGGFTLGLKALAAALLGGVMSVGGALLGGLAIGLFETLWSAYLPIEARDLAVNCLLIAALVLRPNGLAGCPTSPRDPI
jgi:branched-chain amino acid transport system permease protein